MQIKTITKVITKKLEGWLSSIDDIELRNDVRDNMLLSGGSITSLLQQQDVNDYDVYLKDPNVLLRLTEYYTKDVKGVEIWDGRNKEKYDKELEERTHAFETADLFDEDYNNLVGDYAQRSVALRTLKQDQIKLYLPTGGLKVGRETKEDEKPRYEVVFLSPNAISLSDNIQIVIRFYGDNEAIHKTFDFIHATNYFTFKDGLVTNVRALESILTKTLQYQGSLYPLTSIIRIKKFLNREWNIGAGEMLKIMFQISELDLKNPDVLEEQLIGVDVAYFGSLVDILRDTNHEITSHFLNVVIDKIFGESDGEM